MRKSTVTTMDVQVRLQWARNHTGYDWRAVRAFSDAKYFRFPLSEHGGRRTSKVWVGHGFFLFEKEGNGFCFFHKGRQQGRKHCFFN